MRNVQRAASCGGTTAHDCACENEGCRSNKTYPWATAVIVAMQVAFNSGPEAPLASGWEIGALFLFDVTQQVLLAQQPGLHAF